MSGAGEGTAKARCERRVRFSPLRAIALKPPKLECIELPSPRALEVSSAQQIFPKSQQRPSASIEMQYDCPKIKRRKMEVDEILESVKNMESDEQLELWKRMIDNHPFDLIQLRTLLTAIDSRIKLDIISSVPYEIALYIMSFLNPEDLCRAAQVCRSWRIVCEDNRLWREKCIEEKLLDDELTMDVIFRRRIKRRNLVQDEFVKNFNSALPRSEYKSAYLNHINILRNWRTRNLDIYDENISEQQQDGPQQNDERSQQTSEQQPQDQVCQSSSQRLAPSSPPSQEVGCDNKRFIKVKDVNSLKRHKMRLLCHDEAVITCLQYNPRSQLIVSGSDDQTLKVWCSETGKCIATLKGHQGGVWSSQLTENDIVVSGATDRTVRIWKARTGDLLHTLNGHTSTVRCLAVHKDLIVSGSRDATLRLWEIESGNCRHVFVGHTGAVRCVEFRDGIIVSGAYDHLVMVWDATAGNCIHTLACHYSRIYSLQFDGKTIASGSLDSTICIWDAETGKLRHLLEGHQSLTSKMLLKGNLLVSANADSFCKLWDVETGKCLRTLGLDDYANKHTSAITSVYFNDRHVVTSSDDGTVKLWDAKTGMCIRNLVTLPTAAKGGVIWRIRASYTKLICAVGSRMGTEETHMLVLDFDN